MSTHRRGTRSLSSSDLAGMLGIVVLAGTALVLWSQIGDERIPVRDGLGYDGITYARITRDPGGTVLGNGLDVHRISGSRRA